jgi:hypothetical protein
MSARVRCVSGVGSWSRAAALAAGIAAIGVAAATGETGPAVEAAQAGPDAAEPTLASLTEGFAVVNNNRDRDEPTLFTVYREDDRVLALVPDGLLGTPWLMGASVAAGPIATGEQLGSAALEWRRRGGTLDLYAPELRYTSTTKPTLAPGVARAYTDRHIASTPILCETDDGGVLIDLTAFVTSSAPSLVGSFLGGIDASAVRVEKLKAFNQNVELALTAPMRMGSRLWFFRRMDGKLQTLHFSFSALRDNPGFERRAADPRVGYWVHATRDLGRRDPLGTDFVRSIERWDLRKATPGAAPGPPEKPIIFYIERTVPPAYRVHVRRGVEAWNEAFREIGIENAIEVRQQTDTQYADLDPEDIRFNFVRWVPTGYGYAIALHRTDPRTGEILDADVVIDDGWINAWVNDAALLTRETARRRLALMTERHPGLAAVAGQLEERAIRRGILPPVVEEPALLGDREALSRMTDRGLDALAREHALERSGGALARHDHCACTLSEGLGRHMTIARLAHEVEAGEGSDGDPREDPAGLIDGVPEDLIAQNLVALVAHEIGHVLGLRHNFAASAWRPASSIDTYTDPAQEPIASSVMDYIGTFVSEPGAPQGVYNLTRVGPYDRWAIAYGYMDATEEELAAHLARSVEPQHRYMTDEDVYSADPTAMRYDFGSDPVEGRARQLRRIDYLRGRLLERLGTEGEHWARVARAYSTLWFEEWLALWDTTGWIGGTYLSRDANTEGARPPMVNVEPERQRAVLAMVVDRLFREDSLPTDRELLNHLQRVRWYDSNFPSFPWGSGDVDVLGQANIAQFVVLSDLMFWCTPRLANQELRTDPDADALTVPELHRTLTEAIWSEFAAGPAGGRFTNLRPKVGALRRSLQREHTEQLIDLAYRFRFLPASLTSAQLVAVDQLRRVRGRLEPWSQGTALDDYTRVHVREMLDRIDATLEARVARSP